jgi:hypothetical protein
MAIVTTATEMVVRMVLMLVQSCCQLHVLFCLKVLLICVWMGVALMEGGGMVLCEAV